MGFSIDGRTSASVGATLQLQGHITIADDPMLMQSLGGFRTLAPSSRAVAGGSNTYGGLTTVNEGVMALDNFKRVTIDFCKTNKARGFAGQPGNLVAEVDFTAAGGRAADLRVLMHDVRVVRYRRSANAPALRTTNVLASSTYGRGVYLLSTGHIAIAYSRMTHAGAPASAPDISHDVRGRLLVGSDQGVWRRAKTVPQGRLYLGTEVGVF